MMFLGVYVLRALHFHLLGHSWVIAFYFRKLKFITWVNKYVDINHSQTFHLNDSKEVEALIQESA
ncbi:hypothetical protein C1N64_15285 [Pantoea sp. SGAir0215]